MILYFDGACLPRNPGGHMGWGFWLEDRQKIIFQKCGYGGTGEKATNNVAEYLALIHGLEECIARGLNHKPLSVRGDSQLVIQQMQGAWAIGRGAYVEYAEKATNLLEQFSTIFFEHIPRNQNCKADALSKAGAKLGQERASL